MNNLIDNITKRVDKIVANVTDICNVLIKYDSETTVVDTTHFNEVANEMDRIIYDKSRGCNYLNGYQAEENEIRIQVALYKHNISPSFKVKLKGDKWYCTTNNGTYIKENTTATTSNNFSLVNYNNYNMTTNEEGWKPCEIRIKSTTPIETFNITSNCPIIAISCNLPSFTDSIANAIDTKHLRVANILNTNNANSLFLGAKRLTNANINLSKVYDARGIFDGCEDLIELQNLDFSNINLCDGMFNGCSSLQFITLAEGTYPPNGLDLSQTAFTLNNIVDFINNLPTSENLIDIYISSNLSPSTSQLNGFKAKGYNLIKK